MSEPLEPGEYRACSGAFVKRLNGGRLPKHGRECLIFVDGVWCWARRAECSAERAAGAWCIRHEPGWSMVEGCAVFGGVR